MKEGGHLQIFTFISHMGMGFSYSHTYICLYTAEIYLFKWPHSNSSKSELFQVRCPYMLVITVWGFSWQSGKLTLFKQCIVLSYYTHQSYNWCWEDICSDSCVVYVHSSIMNDMCALCQKCPLIDAKQTLKPLLLN